MNPTADHASDPGPILPLAGGRRSLPGLLACLSGVPAIRLDALGPFAVRTESYSIPKCIFHGPGSADPIRIGIFACLHGDEPAGALALVGLLRELARDPSPAEGYLLECFPVCNPTGFEDNSRHSRRGRDLNREFWKSSAEPEVQLLEHELRTRQFHGIIQLHADDTSDGIYGYVRGATLTEHLLRPALEAAERILPRNRSIQIDGFAARDGIIHQHPEGILAPPAQTGPEPFDIVFETPALARLELQVAAHLVALRAVLDEYRRFIAFAQDI